MVDFSNLQKSDTSNTNNTVFSETEYPEDASIDNNNPLGINPPNQQAGYGDFSQPIPATQAQNDLYTQFGINQQQLSQNPDAINRNLSDYLNQITALNKGVTNNAQQVSLEQVQAAYINSLIEAESTKKLLKMNNQTTKTNALLDQQKLALQENYNVLAKQTEMYVLDSQQREQYSNLFFNLQFTIAQNTFSLSKTVVNAAKY
jgi:hypothetical protein